MNAIYTLVFAALLVTLGRMGDVLGRRAMYLGADGGHPADHGAPDAEGDRVVAPAEVAGPP